MSSDGEIIDKEQIGCLADAAGAEGVRVILEAFWTSVADLSTDLSAAMTTGDTEEMARIGHALKGASANVGAALMASRAKLIEAAARSGQLDEAQSAFVRFADDISQTKAAMEALLSAYA